MDKLSRSNIDSLLVVLEEKAISGGNEWGAEIRIKFQDWEDLAYFTNPGEQGVDLLREGNVDGHSFSPSVINTSDWRAFIGYLHSHPTDGTCFSPADALLFTIFCDQVFDRVQRFENAIGVVVTPSESYALTITDPDSLCPLKGRDDEIRQMFIEGIQDGTYLS